MNTYDEEVHITEITDPGTGLTHVGNQVDTEMSDGELGEPIFGSRVQAADDGNTYHISRTGQLLATTRSWQRRARQDTRRIAPMVRSGIRPKLLRNVLFNHH